MIKIGKLTKKFLMKLPQGAYIVSNVFIQKGISVYSNWVTPFPVRDRQWKAIYDSAADRRLCYVFQSKKEAEKWLRQAFKYI